MMGSNRFSSDRGADDCLVDLLHGVVGETVQKEKLGEGVVFRLDALVDPLAAELEQAGEQPWPLVVLPGLFVPLAPEITLERLNWPTGRPLPVYGGL